MIPHIYDCHVIGNAYVIENMFAKSKDFEDSYAV